MKEFSLLCACLAPGALPARAAFQAHGLGVDSRPIVIDGMLDEASWRKAPVHDHFFEIRRRERSEAMVRTQVQLSYDCPADCK
jgi:hypothetical protein